MTQGPDARPSTRCIEHCRQSLDRLQGPEATSSSATELPKTNVGKILRRALREDGLQDGA